jgi:hypothetical protein
VTVSGSKYIASLPIINHLTCNFDWYGIYS